MTATATATEIIPEAANEETQPSAPVSLGDLLTRAAAQVTDIRQLTPELVLGLSSDEVNELRRAERAEVRAGSTAVFPTDYLPQWRRRGARVSGLPDGGQVIYWPLVRERTSARLAVIEAVGRAAAQQGITVIFEELAHTGGETLLTPDIFGTADRQRFFHLRVCSPRVMSDTTRVSRNAVACDPQIPAENTADRHLVFLNPSVVARLDADGCGAQLFVNPFVAPRNGSGALTGTGMDQREAIFARILTAVWEAAQPLRGTDGSGPEPSRDTERLRSAVAALDVLPAFINAISDDTAARKQQLTQEIAQLTNEVDAMRARLMEACRRRREKEQDLEALERTDGALSVRRITRALTDVERIRTRVRPVRSVELVRGDEGEPTVHVVLHPYVMEYQRSRYLLNNLGFTLRLDSSAPQPVWDSVRRGRVSPHPHVSVGGHTCWGEAAVPLQQALSRKDFASAVSLICGWAALYNPRSPHVRIESGAFPRSDLAAGWHPELPVAAR